MGYYPRCGIPTLVAAPATYLAGHWNDLKARGTEPWAKFEPWAARRLAAAFFVREFGQAGQGWDWGASNLTMSGPTVPLPRKGGPAASSKEKKSALFFCFVLCGSQVDSGLGALVPTHNFAPHLSPRINSRF